MIRSVLMVAAVMLLAACQTTNDKLKTITKQGDVVSGSYVAANGRTSVPLPSGEWIVAGSGYGRAGYDNPIERAILLRMGNGLVDGLIEIRTPVAMSRSGFILSDYCEDNNQAFLHRGGRAEGGSQDCWGIHQFNASLTGDLPDYLAQLNQYAWENGIDLPKSGKSVAFRFADRSYFLDVDYMDLWSGEVEEVKSWGREWYPKVKAGFEGS
ncbi:hypothetical protein [Thalassospira aquimaris]|uniref:Uncharacterized protein n=1 Tax=Thalassospira aquimaris TaxID=3037796 RepID=A0ABT6GGV6_9PROT|nr:hypothetical protein [Thalassospira sp. FZY0004]MDG4721143.1 hypothetical protein [Thalassospira sp. FZY0004]